MKRVTLTFDNGPSRAVTPGVLDELNRRDLRAWFCVVGTQLRKPGGAEITRAALEAGHRVANHSLTHGVPLGDEPTEAHAACEIREMHELMDASLGEWGERWFRPFARGGVLGPHAFSEAAWAQLRSLGYSVLLWNSVPRDWDDTVGWVDTALDDIEKRKHTVVVLHDLPTTAMLQLPRFLDALSERDLSVTLDVPQACVPFRDGALLRDAASLTAGAS